MFLGLLSLTTLLPHLGKPVRETPLNRPLAYLHTLAFVWLVKYAVWTFLALNLRFSLYFPEVWAYFGILLTHLAFVGEAFLVPHYGATTRGALAFALGALLANDFVDYWLSPTLGCVLGAPEGRCDLYPPLRYDPGLVLPLATVGLSLASVALAAVVFNRLDSRPRQM